MQKIIYRVVVEDQATGSLPLLNIGYQPPALVGPVAVPESGADAEGTGTGTPGATESGSVEFKYQNITSLNRAVNLAMSFVRRFQSAGQDCLAEVFGKVIDYTDNGVPAAPTDPIRALLPAEAAEQKYARIDTPDPGLRQRISLANKSVARQGGTLNPDFTEDI